nr:tyrosine-type recombinase/integrase [Propionibacterium sp.]
MTQRTRRGFGALRKLPSGRYQASYLGPDLLRYTAPSTFADKDAAVVWLNSERRRIEEAHTGGPAWSSPAERATAERRKVERETFAEYGRRWIAERRNTQGEPLRALTRKDYEQIFEAYLVPTFGPVPVEEISRAAVRQWHNKLDKSKSRAVTKSYGLLRAIMNSAVDDELIAVSPVHIRGAGAAVRKRSVEPATPAELETMARHMPPRLAAAVPIAAWCALRYGELAELRRRDIDVSGRIIKIRRAVTFPGGGPVVGPPKSDAGVRDVAVPPHVWPAVEAHLRDHVPSSPDALLFPTTTGGHLWHSAMAAHFGKARAAAGRSDLRWHDLRHTGATLAAQAGATTAELQARLGHSTAAASQLYQHAAKGRDREIADRLSLLAGGVRA